ncbi:NADP-dependent oxidoreductase [Ulvibacter antarcticus]|uniref:NADPH:quinone reductase-like Zn-dependent oxidoreductase n=1 Tax=Ulvibacter antarcticus TaxID=442714 RepID=A0A3L9ZGW4_9FLAO|nr:NADP-dependent oxidoreductase [Ulvibacter antarcticus]RMA65962.1 NADPH:quinone reductase-like Zn-dependent oxidoreductase [Ulvibacter antarcticus]
MQAIQHIGYGEISENIKFTEIEKPTINKDEVLIETYAASVNPLDIKVIKGKLKGLGKYSLPATMGYDVSGKIVGKGENVSDFNIGDEVYAYVDKQGSFAEFVAVKQNIVSIKPKNTTFEEAASLPLVSLTASQVLKRANLKSGDKILIHAGSGGVGSLAIQLAKAKGAYVYTTTSTSNVAWVKELGADRVIDYKTEDYKTIVKDADVVLDTLGNQYTEDAFKVIKKGGKVITLVGPVDKETANRMKLNKIAKLYLAWKRRKITKNIKLKSAYYSLLLMRANVKQLNEVTNLLETGKIKTNIDKVFPLEDALNAILYVDKGRTKGKVVIKMK